MKKRRTYYLHPLLYFFLSILGFGLLSKLGIPYHDPRIHYCAIPMMLLIAFFVFWVNDKDLLIKKSDFRFERRFLLLNLLPIITIVMCMATAIEALIKDISFFKVLSAIFLSFLIGFSEEGYFRHYLINRGKQESLSNFQVLIYSTLVFGFIHMANLASGLDIQAAFLQSLLALPVGLIAGLLYIETKNISSLIFWHMSFDFNLFATELGTFQSTFIIGYIIDALLIFAVFCILLRYLKKIFTK